MRGSAVLVEADLHLTHGKLVLQMPDLHLRRRIFLIPAEVFLDSAAGLAHLRA
jgi:hypothetical protein